MTADTVGRPRWCEGGTSCFVRGSTAWNCPPWPGAIAANHGTYFTTGGPGKEHGTNKPPPTGRIFERSKGDTRLCPTNVPGSPSLASILAEQCRRPQEAPWVRMIGQRQPGNSSHHHKTRRCAPRGRAVLLGSLTLLLSTQASLPNQVSCFFSTCISSDNPFPTVRQEPALGPGRRSHFLQQLHQPLRL